MARGSRSGYSGIQSLHYGSDNHRVGDQTSSYDLGIDWSPDGKWIIARNSSRDYLELIDPASDVTHAIPHTAGYHGPSWRP